ncbi:class I SAM-dependent methyltransferase [Natrarchaeobius oligotrophus]|nr:class I SAM-dependent methyltransferase [Natrarchaeobius chitinivorans]
MKAVRASNLIDSNDVDPEHDHLLNMYTGRLSRYYHRRLDMALQAAPDLTDKTVLQLGSGNAVFSLTLLRDAKGVYAVEISRSKIDDGLDILDRTGASTDHLSIIHADGTRMPMQDDAVDVAFALDTLEHIPNERRAVEELRRVLSNEGRLIISAPLELGFPIIYRDIYRLMTGRRQNSKSISEYISAAAKRPPVDNPTEHRGYDYRQTIEFCRNEFSNVSVEYCPFDPLKWINPTSIISADC